VSQTLLAELELVRKFWLASPAPPVRAAAQSADAAADTGDHAAGRGRAPSLSNRSTVARFTHAGRSFANCASRSSSWLWRHPSMVDFLTVFHSKDVARPCEVIKYRAIVRLSSASNSVQSRAS
jgi:hypothetical protein